MLIAIDYETYYTGTYSVRTLGNHAYVMDPRFHAGLVALSTFPDDGASETVVGKPEEIQWERFAGHDWVAHNADFDRAVHERLIDLGKIPDVRPREWLCSAAAAAYLQLPRDLAGACKAVLGITVDKTVRTSMCGKKWEANLFGDSGILEYASKDAILCGQLWQQIGHLWPERERRLWRLTRDMGERGVHLDIEALERGITTLKQGILDCDAAIPFSPSGSIPKFRAACEAANVAPPKSTSAKDPGFDKWLDANMNNDSVLWVRHMQRRRSLNRTLKVLESMKLRCFDGRLRYDLRYYGGSTGRWAGGGGLNMQNFNRADVAGVDLRHCLVAAPGHVLAIVDYAQIEARVLLWLARDFKTLDLLRGSMDIYEAHARATMGYRDPRPLKEVDAKLRQMAKARVLGLGFGCGPDKFIIVAKIMGGLDITFEESRATVAAYRNSNPKIVKLWRRLEEAFVKAGETEARRWLLPYPRNQMNDGARWLVYRDIDISMDDMTATVCGDTEHTYGAKLTENWTQGTARDVMADAWVRCVNAGHHPIMTIHDELVFELPEATAADRLKEIEEIMSAPVAWAPELPVAVDGHLSKFYCK